MKRNASVMVVILRHLQPGLMRQAHEDANSKQGFGVTARSTLDTRKLDPTGIIVFHQADVGEFLRDEDTMF